MAFYRESGYSSPIDRLDTFLVVEDRDLILAALRICREQETVVMRGMRVRRSHQRRGIGSSLLQYAASVLAGDDCYCIPFAHLEGFYAQVGFRRIDPASAPEFLRGRERIYRDELGLDVILMHRPGVAAGK